MAHAYILMSTLPIITQDSALIVFVIVLIYVKETIMANTLKEFTIQKILQSVFTGFGQLTMD